MNKLVLVAALLAALPAAANDPLLDDARKVAGALPPKLLAVLSAEMQKSGPEGAIAVCKETAPQLAKAASEESGWAIRRVSLRNRNPKAVPDAWERAALEEFDRRQSAGENPATLEKAEVVSEGGQKAYRYMKALPTLQPCTGCHGDPATMKPAVIEKLASLYPQDRAVGYKVGDIRGAITLRKPL